MKYLVKRYSISTALAVLLASILLVIFSAHEQQRVESFRLQDLVPTYLDGWQVEELAVATSPEVRKAVDEQLNFDEVVYRRYRRGESQFEVYIAYWKPGKQPPRLVAAHTPDICWVVNGWIPQSSTGGSAEMKAALKPLVAHFRTFRLNDSLQNVFFWHLVGEEETDFTTTLEDASSRSFLNDLRRRKFFAKPQAQIFARISSSQAWSVLEQNAEFLGFIRQLAGIRPMQQS